MKKVYQSSKNFVVKLFENDRQKCKFFKGIKYI